jgi:tRNA nucleotidyltransferase (CCA-adding enzyme)
MSDPNNLKNEIEEHLPAVLVELMRTAGELAQQRGERLYLVGGVVRDLILERDNLDLDLVLEGDAISLAQALALQKKGEAVTHSRFGTATVRWHGRSTDLATARAETYARPGALPDVKPGTIETDLARRDFTINAMAVTLGEPFGGLLDPYGGRQDLDDRLVRVLHPKSFTDDATRIWRALRYEQRLDFTLEPATLALLKRDTARLDTISGDRIRHELERVLREEMPEKALQRAAELGALARLHPALKGDAWLAEKFARAREMSLPEPPPAPLYLALMVYRLGDAEAEKLMTYLNLPRASVLALRETAALREKIGELSVPGLAPSRIYDLLHGFSTTPLLANAIAAGSPITAEHIQLYLDPLRYVNPVLGGEDLKKLGVPEGPQMKEILHMLRAARLDGKIDSRQDEVEWVRGFLLTG